MRPYPERECPSGRPELLYNFPEAYGMLICSARDSSLDFNPTIVHYTDILSGYTNNFVIF